MHSSIYISQISQFISRFPFLPWCPYICPLHLSLYLCFANRFICTIFHFFNTVGKNADWWSHYGEHHGGSLKKLKRELPYDPATLLLGHKPGRNCNSKRSMFPNVHCSTVYNSQDMEATQTFINRGTDKLDMTHIYNWILLHHNMEGNLSFSEMWMDIETIIHSEVSQTEKNKYHVLMHICGIYKLVFLNSICKGTTNTFLNDVA